MKRDVREIYAKREAAALRPTEAAEARVFDRESAFALGVFCGSTGIHRGRVVLESVLHADVGELRIESIMVDGEELPLDSPEAKVFEKALALVTKP